MIPQRNPVKSLKKPPLKDNPGNSVNMGNTPSKPLTQSLEKNVASGQDLKKTAISVMVNKTTPARAPSAVQKAPVQKIPAPAPDTIKEALQTAPQDTAMEAGALEGIIPEKLITSLETRFHSLAKNVKILVQKNHDVNEALIKAKKRIAEVEAESSNLRKQVDFLAEKREFTINRIEGILSQFPPEPLGSGFHASIHGNA